MIEKIEDLQALVAVIEALIHDKGARPALRNPVGKHLEESLGRRCVPH
jgi:hypothetical protein